MHLPTLLCSVFYCVLVETTAKEADTPSPRGQIRLNHSSLREPLLKVGYQLVWSIKPNSSQSRTVTESSGFLVRMHSPVNTKVPGLLARDWIMIWDRWTKTYPANSRSQHQFATECNLNSLRESNCLRGNYLWRRGFINLNTHSNREIVDVGSITACF